MHTFIYEQKAQSPVGFILLKESFTFISQNTESMKAYNFST